MRAGRLKDVGTFQRPETTRNAYGEPVESWVDVATVRGELSMLKGRELTFARQRQSSITHQWYMRERADLGILGTWRLVVDGVAMQITEPPVEGDEDYTIGLIVLDAGAERGE